MEVRLARHAMATRFELVLHGGSEPRLRAAGEEALDEITRLDAALSRHRPDSEISAVNRAAARGWVRVTPEVAALLTHALALSHASEGAFDITVAPLLAAWGLSGGGGAEPSPAALAAARECVGAGLVEVDPGPPAVRFHRPGVQLDLGSIGKGFALDRAAARLREAGVENALLHGGTSTVVALGEPPDGGAWKVAVDLEPPSQFPISNFPAAPPAVFALRDESLSVSAVWGRGFEAGGRFHGHVLDPRSGRPVARNLLAAVVLPSATVSDALSTALLVVGAASFENWAGSLAAFRGLLLEHSAEPPGWRVRRHGIP